MTKKVKATKTAAVLGGEARAAALPPEERRKIARAAAQERWAKAGKIARAAFGSDDRPLNIAGFEIPCYVLEDGRRVVTAVGLMTSLNMSTGKHGIVRVAGMLAKFVDNGLPYERLAESIASPIPFVTPTSSRALGFEAKILPEMCEAVLAARRDGFLHHNRGHIAERCEILLGGLSRVGIVALVDEATGFEKVRRRDELQQILSAYISESLLPWTKRFPDDFFDQMFRLRRWERDPMKKGPQGPRYAGKLVKKLVYEKLPANVLEELEKKNPIDAKGQRRHRHHQLLTEDIGNPHLEKHVAAVVALMRASPDWATFDVLFSRAFPPADGSQQSLLFSEATLTKAAEEAEAEAEN